MNHPNNFKNLATLQNSNIFWNFSLDKGRLKSFVSWFLTQYGEKKTIQLLEQLKELGFGYATKAGISLGIEDLKIPPQKSQLLRFAEMHLARGIISYRRGQCTGIEKMQQFIETWHETSETLKQEVVRNFEKTDVLNPVYMMAFSGARGNLSQVRQLVGMRGLMSDPQGKIIDFPIQSNFREGLTLTEYLISTYGARKGIVDTALRTATAGYLTRRLVDVAQHVVVSKFDCGTERGIFLFDMKDGPKTIYSFQNRLTGRVLARDILISSVPETLNDQNNSKKIGFRNQEITPELARGISQITKKALVRSPLTCEARKFVCQLCYGWSLATSRLVSIGEAVGVIAGQSIGEPGTQLTMRTFHTGGVFSGGITEQIHAPFDGTAQYSEPIAGTCVRTSQGELVFLTKSSGTLFFKSLEKISSSQSNSRVELEPTSSLITNAYKIPPFTLLFARHGQTVKKKNLLAQISTVTGQQKTMQTIEQTIYSNLEGEIYYSQLDLLEDIDEKSGERISKSEDWAKVWVLSGKIFKDSLNSNFFAKKFDYISKNSIINQIQWVNNFSELTKFEYLLPQFKDDSKLDLNFSFYINSNSHKKNFMDVLKRNENSMDFLKSKKFSLSSNRSLLNSSEKTFYINSKRSVRDKFLTEEIPSKNLKKIQIYSFYPFKSNFRKVFTNTLSQTILSLPIVYPGILKKLVQNKRAKSKNSQKVLTYLDLNKANQKILIRKLNLNKNFQISNGKKSNLFHPLILSNYVSFFLNVQVLKYHFKRKPTVFPLVRETPIFLTNFSTLKNQSDKIISNSKKLPILKYQDELLYKKLLSKNKQIKQAFTAINSNLKFSDSKKSLKFHEKNSLKKPLKKLYISNPTIVLNSTVNRYQKLGYLTSVQIHGNEKDEFFSFLPLKTDEIKSINLNFSNPSKMNSQMFIQAKDNLKFNSFNTRDQNLGLKNTYFWDFPSAGGFYWYPKFSQSLTNGIFIFSSPVLPQQKLEQKVLTSKTKNFKTAFLAMKKYSPFINLAQSQLKKKKNRSFCISKNNINHKKFTSFNKYRANPLNFPSKINFSQDYKIFTPPILKRYSSRLNPIYFSNFNKKTYQNKFQSYFLNPKTSHHFEFNNIHFKNSYSKVNGYLKKNLENRLFSKKNKVISKHPEILSIKFDLSKKFSASCHEIYWLPQETYLVNTWLKQNQCENYKSNNILCTEKRYQPAFKSVGPSFYSTNTQGFKKEFNFKQEGIYTLKIFNKSSRVKNTFQFKKTNKSEKKLLKRKTDKVVFKENFQLPFDSLKNQIFWNANKNFNFSKKSNFFLKMKFLNFLKMRKVHNISEFKFKKRISKDFQLQNKQFKNQPINFSSAKKMPYKSFLSFVPFVKRKTLRTSINFDPKLKKSMLKKIVKVYKKTLQITVKSGWVYKTTNFSNILNLDKTWINFGQSIINDVCFEHQKVFVEILSVSDKLEKDLIKLPQQAPQIPNHFKPSIFIKNPKCRFYKNLSNARKKFDKTNISNPLNSGPNKEISLFIRPLNYSILPNLYEMKKNLNLAIQKTKKKSRNLSYFIYQKYYFDCLNTQINPTQLISQFPPFDFQLNWSNSFNRANRFLKESVVEKVKWKKKQFQTKTFQKINLLNSILELQKFKSSILSKQQNYFYKNSYLSVSHKIRYNISNKNTQNIYFSQYPVNFFKLKVSLNNSTTNFSSISKVSLNSSVFESDNVLKPFQNQGRMNKQIQAAYLDILRNRTFKKFVRNKNQKGFISKLNLSQNQTNSSQTFKLKRLSKVSFQSKKLVSFKLFSNVGTSIPNFEFSFLEKYAYFANQRIFSAYFYKEQMSNYLKLSLMNLKNYSNESLNIKRFVLTNSWSSGLSEVYYDSPIIKNQFIANYSNLKTQKIFGLTNFYSPFEGEVLKIYSPTQELNILKNGFNTILEKGFIQDRQNQKLILTKSDLFSLKFIPIHKTAHFYLTENEQQSRKDEIKQFKNESSKDFSQFLKKPIIKKSFQSLCDFHQDFQKAETNFNIAVSRKNYQIQNVNMVYNNKRYKVKEISFSLFSDLQKIRLGQFLSPGDLLNGQLTLKNCGQIIHLNSEKLTLRKAEFFSLSPKAILHKYNGHFLRKNSPVMTLPFQTLKTGDIVQGIPKVEQYLEARTTLQGRLFLNSLPVLLHAIFIRYLSHLEMEKAVRQSFLKIQQILVDGVQRVYRSQGVSIADKHLEIIVRQMTSKVKVIHGGQTGFFPGELLELEFVEKVNQFLMVKIRYEPVVLGITRASLEVDSFLSAASFQQTTKILTRSALENKKDFLKGLKENLLVGNLLPAGTGYVRPISYE